MIDLSKKAAERFKIDWNKLPERQGDFWKIDVFMIERIPMLLIIHEYTLFTIIRRKSDFKKIEEVALEIRKCCSWYNYAGDFSPGKNTDKKLNGSINEMKRLLWGIYSPDDINRMEMSINQCPFSALSVRKYGYGVPFETVEEYRKGLWPPKSDQ